MTFNIDELLRKRIEQEQGEMVLGHVPCIMCTSSDAMCVYKNSKGYNVHCYSCGQSKYKGITEELIEELKEKSKHGYKNNLKRSIGGLKLVKQDKVAEGFSKGKVRAIPERLLKESVCHKYGVRTQVAKGSETIVRHIYPYYNAKGEMIAQHIRICPKEGFPWEYLDDNHSHKEDITLFGQNIFNPGQATKLTIVTGEIDALSAYQMNGELYPVVSIPTGDRSLKKIFKNDAVYKFVDSYKEIVLGFDGDESGQKAAKEMAEIFPSKVKIMSMRYKDANEYLKNSASSDWVSDFHRAQQYSPEGLVRSSELIAPLLAGEAVDTLAFFPWKGLNRMYYGIRGGELLVFASGTGVGKSAISNEIAYHVQKQTGKTVGLLCLEQSKVKTAAKLLSIAMDKPIVNLNIMEKMPDYLKKDPMYQDLVEHIKKSGGSVTVDHKELEKKANELLGSDKFIIFDHFGSADIDTILKKVYQMWSVYDCKFVVLDHVSIVVSSQDNGDERKALDAIMTKLRMIVEQTGICLVVVSHLKRPQGKGHEEGAQTSVSELRGSAGIGQVADGIFGFERDQQHPDEFIRNCTIIRGLKNRLLGDSGTASCLFYNKLTGRLHEIEMSEYEARLHNSNEKQKESKSNDKRAPWEESPTLILD